MRALVISVVTLAALAAATSATLAAAPSATGSSKIVYENVKGVPGEVPPTFSAPVGHVWGDGVIVTSSVKNLHQLNVPHAGFSIDAGG